MNPSYRVTAHSPEECLTVLTAPLTVLSGIGAVRAAQLARHGLHTIEDLLYHLPLRYDDRRTIHPISAAQSDEKQSFVGQLTRVSQRRGRGAKRILIGQIEDGTGTLNLLWLNPKRYLSAALKTGTHLCVHGKVVVRPGSAPTLTHPEFEVTDPEQPQQGELLPVYRKPGNLSQTSLRRWIREALERYQDFLPSYLPGDISARHELSDLKGALWALHYPHRDTDLSNPQGAERTALVFDELFYFQLGLGLQRMQRTSRPGVVSRPQTGSLSRKMRELLPFRLTNGQDRVLKEIQRDMELSQPMQRLLHGDVGSGKTIVAWFAALHAIDSGHQAALLAPTELLAEQHYCQLAKYAQRLGIVPTLLVGSLARKDKEHRKEEIRKGKIAFVVGTHALLQEDVCIPGMGLGIIDEQHRFGVAQRRAFRQLRSCAGSHANAEPDLLLMSATPIPRSLAMVWYGDMAVSLLDEHPPAKATVHTVVIDASKRAKLYERLRNEVGKGHQVYVVLPLVDRSDKLQLRDATNAARKLSQGTFRDLRVGLIHGQMSAEERDEVMRHFQTGELQVLVATTVIEVGIDVPAATVMVIEHAERFGLAQLHQLRGRVGRGADASYCVLVQYDSTNADARHRLSIMERTSNGFDIAEADLELRGMGEMWGVRQTGLPSFRVTNPFRDTMILKAARDAAQKCLADDPFLKALELRPMKVLLEARWGDRMDLYHTG